MEKLEKPPTAPEPVVMKVTQAVMSGLVPGTLEFYKALDAEASQRGMIPSNLLGPFGGIRDRWSQDAQSLIKEQDTLKKIGEGVMQQFQELHTKQRFAESLAPPMGVAHQQYGIPFDPSQMKAGPDVQVPGDLVPHTFDIDMLQPGIPTGRRPMLQAGPNRDQNLGEVKEVAAPFYGTNTVPTTVPDEQAKMLPYQVAAMQPIQEGRTVLDQETGRALPTSLAKPMAQFVTAEEANLEIERAKKMGAIPDTDIPAFAPGSKVPVAMLSNLITQASNIKGKGMSTPSAAVDPEERESRAMFNQPFRDLTGTVSPAESARIKRELDYDIKPGMSRQAAVSVAMKQRDIAIGGNKAYVVAGNTVQGKQDAPLGARYQDFRKMTPDGKIVMANQKWSETSAVQQGYVDTKDDKEAIEKISTIKVTEDRVREVFKLGREIFKADPGILAKGKQLAELALSSLANAGRPVMYEGKKITLGEAVNLYNAKTKQMLEAVARGVNAVKGAGTEGDVQRQMEGFAGPTDTAVTAEAKFKGLEDAFAASRKAYYGMVFGEEAADKFWEQYKGKGKGGDIDSRLDAILKKLEQQ